MSDQPTHSEKVPLTVLPNSGKVDQLKNEMSNPESKHWSDEKADVVSFLRAL